ncbi:hypothetical protein N865_14025 [Intrasporangium oryzae NRRL B-24470]|uniref:Uncharacterized protein n=1 Tax=Intrasporangium oryzae NRRL B-24470 TaxID=1386089 RepID=W9G9X7_9MICO|nr:hypothetical protein N865_14025 [Intrasporangium oryzae NRRL B-24470]
MSGLALVALVLVFGGISRPATDPASSGAGGAPHDYAGAPAATRTAPAGPLPWRAGPPPDGIIGGARSMLTSSREIPGTGFGVEEWARCREAGYGVDACPRSDVVFAFRFRDEFGNRLVVNRGRWDRVGYLGQGQWLITGYRDAAVVAARMAVPHPLVVRSDIVVGARPDMIHAPCPDSVWPSQGWTRIDADSRPAVCLVDESTWQLIRIATPDLDVWHESPSQPLWGTRRSPETGAFEAVVMQDDGTFVGSEVAASDRTIMPVANLPYGLLAVYRTRPASDSRAGELVYSTDDGRSWNVREVPAGAVLATTRIGSTDAMTLPSDWRTWAPRHG